MSSAEDHVVNARLLSQTDQVMLFWAILDIIVDWTVLDVG
ncbi:hypothetical protein A2U01_0097047, partial [Trifolium medium]|nr:hypothetical protein [Trifolium medium]